MAGRGRNIKEQRIPDLLKTPLTVAEYEELLLRITDKKKARLRHSKSAVG